MKKLIKFIGWFVILNNIKQYILYKKTSSQFLSNNCLKLFNFILKSSFINQIS